jgi:hypothetical protein
VPAGGIGSRRFRESLAPALAVTKDRCVVFARAMTVAADRLMDFGTSPFLGCRGQWKTGQQGEKDGRTKAHEMFPGDRKQTSILMR